MVGCLQEKATNISCLQSHTANSSKPFLQIAALRPAAAKDELIMARRDNAGRFESRSLSSFRESLPPFELK
jgi:hypothetical protein